MKIAVYTAISGNKSELLDPPVVHDGIDYIAFTDQIHRTHKVWQKRDIIPFTLTTKFTNRRNAKVFKILPDLFLPEYDVTIYHDGGHFCLMNPYDIIKTYLPNDTDDLAVFKHRWNTCIYKEAEDVKREKVDDPILVDTQVDYYRKNGYPVNNGLYELPVLIRKKSQSNMLIGLRWWEQICKYSSRDQISFPIVMWTLGKTPIILPGNGNGLGNSNNIVPHYKV